MPGLGTGGPPDKITSAPNLSLSYSDISQESVISQGRSAEVHKGTVDTGNGTIQVAVKRPPVDSTIHSSTVEHFAKEAQVWNRIDDHDHIVGLIGHGKTPVPWITMEYMNGGTLETILNQGQLPPAQATWIGLCICRALRHAHRHGIVHHDIKPANILFDKSDDNWMVPKVSDWGVAEVLSEPKRSEYGLSPRYAAPEQLDPDEYGNPDDRTDVYQVVVLLYQVFTGTLPYQGTTDDQIQAVLHAEPQAPSTVADLPLWIDDLLLPGLSKSKSERYDSIVYLRDQLKERFDQEYSESRSRTTNSFDANLGKETSVASSSEINSSNKRQKTVSSSSRKATSNQSKRRTTDTSDNKSEHNGATETLSNTGGTVVNIVKNMTEIQRNLIGISSFWVFGLFVINFATPFGGLVSVLWTSFCAAMVLVSSLILLSDNAGQSSMRD